MIRQQQMSVTKIFQQQEVEETVAGDTEMAPDAMAAADLQATPAQSAGCRTRRSFQLLGSMMKRSTLAQKVGETRTADLQTTLAQAARRCTLKPFQLMGRGIKRSTSAQQAQARLKEAADSSHVSFTQEHQEAGRVIAARLSKEEPAGMVTMRQREVATQCSLQASTKDEGCTTICMSQSTQCTLSWKMSRGTQLSCLSGHY